MKNRINLAIRQILIGLVGIALLSSCHQNSASNVAEAEVKKYPFKVMNKLDVELQTIYPTVLKGEIDSELKPRVDGTIIDVFVDEGSLVRKGQPLFKIDSPSAIQELETAQANFNKARLDIERMRPLAEKGIISDVLVESYQNVFKSAEAAVEKAKASVSWTTVTSPIDGTVGTLTYRRGSLVNSSSVLTTISNASKIVAYFSMNEKELFPFLKKWDGKTQAEKIKNMPAVKLILADGSEYEELGKIETISGLVDNSGAVNFRAVFNNPQGLLRSGTSGKILIPQVLKDIFVIPQKATFSQQDKILVYQYHGGKVSSKSIVAKTTPDGKNYAILEGLETGDTIVTDGLATLFNGLQIQLQ